MLSSGYEETRKTQIQCKHLAHLLMFFYQIHVMDCFHIYVAKFELVQIHIMQ